MQIYFYENCLFSAFLVSDNNASLVVNVCLSFIDVIQPSKSQSMYVLSVLSL